VIPTVLLLGLLVGRWWVVPAAGLLWIALLAIFGDLGLDDIPLATGLAMANAAVGVALRRFVALSLRTFWGQSR
jgi:hypothetical protein